MFLSLFVNVSLKLDDPMRLKANSVYFRTVVRLQKHEIVFACSSQQRASSIFAGDNLRQSLFVFRHVLNEVELLRYGVEVPAQTLNQLLKIRDQHISLRRLT